MPDTRSRILTVTKRIQRKRGIAAVSLRDVARTVGITPMAIYRHFRDKDALIDALVAAGFAEWERRLSDAARATSARARVERGLLAYAEFALAERRTFELMFFVPRATVPKAPDSVRQTTSPAFARMIASVVELMERGDLPRGDPGDVILRWWAMAHGLIALHFSGRFGHDDDVFRRVYARAIRETVQSGR